MAEMAETAERPLSPQILIGPKKYVQGRGLMAKAGKYVADLGKDAVVIADGEVWGLVGPALERSFKDAEVHLIREVFGGECSHREIDRITAVAERKGASVVVGVGGGRP